MKKLYNCEIVNISEIDKHAVNSYCAIHGTDPSINLGDITKIDVKKLPKINVLVGGSPCTSFSTAGKQEGSKWTCLDCGNTFDPLELDDISKCACPKCNSENIEKTESSLIVYWFNIFKATKPNFAIFENVKNLLSKKFKPTFDLFASKVESMGYNLYYQVMNSKDYGIPQNRERVIFLAIRKDVDNGKFKFPEPYGLKFSINDLLENYYDVIKNTDARIIVDDTIYPSVQESIYKNLDEIIKSDKSIYRIPCTSGWSDKSIGKVYVPTLRACNPSTLALQTVDTIEGKKYYIKRLSALEAFRFMGFTDEDYHKAAQVTSEHQLYKQCGNSIVVNVVYEVLKSLFEAMPELFEDIKILDLFAGIGAFEKAFKTLIVELNESIIEEATVELFRKGIPFGYKLYSNLTFGEQQCTLTDGYPELEKFANEIQKISNIDFFKIWYYLPSKVEGNVPTGTINYCNYSYSISAVNGLNSLIYLVENIICSEYETGTWEHLDEIIEADMNIYYEDYPQGNFKFQVWTVKKTGPKWYNWQMIEELDEEDKNKTPEKVDLFTKWDKDFLEGLPAISCA